MKLSSQRVKTGVGHGAIYCIYEITTAIGSFKKCISHTSERLFTKSLRVTSYRNTKVYELMFSITATISSDTDRDKPICVPWKSINLRLFGRMIHRLQKHGALNSY